MGFLREPLDMPPPYVVGESDEHCSGIASTLSLCIDYATIPCGSDVGHWNWRSQSETFGFCPTVPPQGARRPQQKKQMHCGVPRSWGFTVTPPSRVEVHSQGLGTSQKRKAQEGNSRDQEKKSWFLSSLNIRRDSEPVMTPCNLFTHCN